MTGRIEDYTIVGDMQSAALICTDGSVDWLANALELSGHRDERRSVPG